MAIHWSGMQWLAVPSASCDAAQVESAGFTIAPLRSNFLSPGEPSHESLVTAVFKVDLGGWLAADTWTGRCLAPFLRQSFNATLASCAIWLRDRVRTMRFGSTAKVLAECKL